MANNLKYVLITIPAVWINKDKAWSDYARSSIETATGECFGRYKWIHDSRLVVTAEQFGKLVVNLLDNKLGYTFDVHEMHPQITTYIKINKAVEEDFYRE